MTIDPTREEWLEARDALAASQTLNATLAPISRVKPFIEAVLGPCPPEPAITDEMVERAARELHRISDDVYPFDLPSPGAVGRRSVDDPLDRFIQRRERHLTTARAALEAALGGAT